MKKIKNTLLPLLALICTLAFTIPTHEQDTTSPKAYKEYYNLLDSLVNGNPNDENNI